jgi:uncharacterized glyoxalase superfamily protein PhnB
MSVKPIPDGYHTVTPYLVVDGVDKVVAFAKQAFGAKEPFPAMKRPDGSIGHAEIQVGDSKIMLGGTMPGYPAMPAMLYLYVEDCDAWYKRAIAAGATSVMEPADQFYGDRNCGVKDVAGNQWWFATHKEDVPPEELGRRAEEAFKKRAQK